MDLWGKSKVFFFCNVSPETGKTIEDSLFFFFGIVRGCSLFVLARKKNEDFLCFFFFFWLILKKKKKKKETLLFVLPSIMKTLDEHIFMEKNASDSKQELFRMCISILKEVFFPGKHFSFDIFLSLVLQKKEKNVPSLP